MATLIRLKYNDCLERSNEDGTESSVETVKEVLININCPLGLIVNYIREVTGYKDEFDLTDESNYQGKNILQLQPHISGLDVLQSNTTYLIITYSRDADGQIVDTIPLVNAKTTKKLSDTQTKVRKPTKKGSNTKLRSKKKTGSADIMM